MDKVVCAIPDDTDNRLYLEVRNHCMAFAFVGDENDVLARYHRCAEAYEADIIMRITGDCPLISPELCGQVLADLKSSNAEYASNIGDPRTFPKGTDCEVFTRNLLDVTNFQTNDAHDREHVTPFMRRTKVERVTVTNTWPMEGRLCIDTEDDYKVVCAHFGHEPYAAGVNLSAA